MEGRTEIQRRREERIRRGTTAPGPRPRGGGGEEILQPRAGETLDRLAGDFCLFQLRNGHRYSTDDLLCAAFACDAAEALGVTVDRALDLGSGIGSVALLLAWRLPEAHVDAVEAQPISVALARRSVRWNGVEERVRIRQGDLRETADCEPGVYALVTGTPPYFDPKRGSISQQPQRGPCRFELRGGLESYVLAAAHALRPGGVAVLVQPWRDADRIRTAAVGSGLGLALCQPVLFKEGRAPALGLFALTHDNGERALAPLTIRCADGSYSPELRALKRKMGFPLEQGFAVGPE